MTDLVAARALMGISLAFHIIFAALGIGLPLLLVLAEGMYLRTKNKEYLALAKKWAKATAILFAVGAVSGTVLSFELGLLWPGFMKYAGSIIGMPFSMEGFAFFIEAIFLGLYLYGRKLLSPFVHWLTTIPVAVAGAMSGAFIIAANGWMNAPSGFEVVNGQVVNINPLAALFNPAWGVEALHGTIASFVAVGFAVAAVYAVKLLKNRDSSYARKGLTLSAIMAGIAIPLQLVSGHISADWVAANQPAKFAAMEGHFETAACAPINIGGIPNVNTGKTEFALQIPCGLNLLLLKDFNYPVTGLNDIPEANRPDPVKVHAMFDLMVGTGFALFGVAALVGWLWWRKKELPTGRKTLWAVALTGPLGFVALEAGWMVTELGRQPWVVYGFVRTSDAVTSTPGVLPHFIGFVTIYVALACVVVWLLRRLAQATPEGIDDSNKHNDAADTKEKDYATV